MGPTRFERAHHRSRRWVLPGYTKGPVVAFGGVGGSADPRGQSPSGRRPHHWWPRAAAFRFSRSQRTRRRISRVRFVRNQITSVSVLVSIGAERIERPPQDLQSRMLPLHHAPPNVGAAEHGELSLSIRWEARHGPFRILRGDAGHGIRFQGAGSISMCRRASRCA